MTKKIAVLGAGAIGGSIGADLTLAGHDVVLIDAWAAHVEAMKTNGLCVALPDQEIHAPVRARRRLVFGRHRPGGSGGR